MASNETSSDSVGDSQNEITTNSANTSKYIKILPMTSDYTCNVYNCQQNKYLFDLKSLSKTPTTTSLRLRSKCPGSRQGACSV